MRTAINWYPGHMAKTKRLIKEKIGLIDIVLEVVDARVPFSSKLNDIDNYINQKPRLLVMTKIDLCDMSETKKWVKYYEEKGYSVILMDLINKWNTALIINKIKEILSEKNEKRLARGMKIRKYRALVVGMPNVGKSTLINRLAGKKATNVANKPGVTKVLSWIRINDEVELLDSPGILIPKFEDREVALNLSCMTSIKEEILPLDEVAVYILEIMNKYYPNSLKERYGINSFDIDDVVPAYETIAKKRGCFRSGEADFERVTGIIINDMKEGRLGPVTFDRM